MATMSSRYPHRDHYPNRSHLSASPSNYAPSASSRSSPRPQSYAYDGAPQPSFRAATSNSRGQFSASVMETLESQNDEQVEGLRGKVKMLKEITEAIGNEVRESSSLIQSMNDGFDATRVKLKGTMTRMLVMAQKSGIGWRAWVLFFFVVMFVFSWVWLF